MKPTFKQNLAEVLKRRVLSTEVAPGELLNEVGLSREFGISRTPSREVVQRLSGEGYLTLAAHRGAKVASPFADTGNQDLAGATTELAPTTGTPKQRPSGLISVIPRRETR